MYAQTNTVRGGDAENCAMCKMDSFHLVSKTPAVKKRILLLCLMGSLDVNVAIFFTPDKCQLKVVCASEVEIRTKQAISF